MIYDYYAYRKEQLKQDGCLESLYQAVVEFEQAKRDQDQDARRKAQKNIKIFAEKAVEIEPHLSYLWYESLWYESKSSDRKNNNDKCKNNIRDAWHKNLTVQTIPEDFRFIPNSSDIQNLPALSFILRVPLKLKKPYLSKDDRTFHILDSPVRKDKVFQVPMVAPSGWKGALKMAMLQQFVEWWCSLDEQVKTQRQYRKEFVAKRVSIGRIFGTEKGFEIDQKKFESYLDNLGDKKLSTWYKRYIRRYISQTGFFSGRLYFYPTFFDKLSLEVINPHDRKKGTSKNPILIESVPIGATGEFVLLYVPFGKVDETQVAQDLELLVQGIEAMLTVYGFGAKTSSGFGVAQIYKNQDFLTKEEYKKFRLDENKPYSDKMYENNKARHNSQLHKILFSGSSPSELSDRAQQIIQNLGKS